jgi:hypothetical protein
MLLFRRLHRPIRRCRSNRLCRLWWWSRPLRRLRLSSHCRLSRRVRQRQHPRHQTRLRRRSWFRCRQSELDLLLRWIRLPPRSRRRLRALRWTHLHLPSLWCRQKQKSRFGLQLLRQPRRCFHPSPRFLRWGWNR